jgi:hypothetical protein
MNEKIKSLLKKKEQNDGLERFLKLYEKLDSYIEARPTALDRIKATIIPLGSDDEQVINYFRADVSGCNINITVYCDEVMRALRDYYERKIIELMESETAIEAIK